jgi:hypothetical protein
MKISQESQIYEDKYSLPWEYVIDLRFQLEVAVKRIYLKHCTFYTRGLLLDVSVISIYICTMKYIYKKTLQKQDILRFVIKSLPFYLLFGLNKHRF